MRILLVEDDKNVSRFIEKGLKENSFSVDIAENGEDGLHLATQETYDLIILDIMLPLLSGRNLSMKMRHLHKEFSVAKDHYFLVPVY